MQIHLLLEGEAEAEAEDEDEDEERLFFKNDGARERRAWRVQGRSSEEEEREIVAEEAIARELPGDGYGSTSERRRRRRFP
jgi:hypothetical protein